MTHPGELTLRRILADEAVGAAPKAHVAGCAACAAKLQALREEQARFEAEVPFERFALGVEKAQRSLAARGASAGAGERRRFLVALAAGLVVLLGMGLVVRFGEPASTTRLKGGGATVDFVVAGVKGAQRAAREVEPLAAGERVRIGVAGHRFVLVLSIDEAGEVSTVYSGGERSMALGGAELTWLPESLEFTGSGREVVSVFLSDEPLSAAQVSASLKAAWTAAQRGQGELPPLDVPGVQVHRTFLKP